MNFTQQKWTTLHIIVILDTSHSSQNNCNDSQKGYWMTVDGKLEYKIPHWWAVL